MGRMLLIVSIGRMVLIVATVVYQLLGSLSSFLEENIHGAWVVKWLVEYQSSHEATHLPNLKSHSLSLNCEGLQFEVNPYTERKPTIHKRLYYLLYY